MSSINISVVIATCNRASLLASCLEAFSRQDYDRQLFEVIVINDGSTDGTETFLTCFKKNTGLIFQFVNQENKGVAYSRNIGIDRAQGRYIAFTDDDCIVPENWLSRIAALWEVAEPTIGGLGGPLDSRPGRNYVSRYTQFLDEFNYIPVLGNWWITPRHKSKLFSGSKIAYLRTSNAAFKRQYLKEVGGFDINFRKPGGEDPDLCYRMLNLGVIFCFDKDLVVLHNSRDSLRSYFRSMKNYIKGEFRKKSKIHCYRNKSIRRSYVLIPAQKFLSFCLSIVIAPFSMTKLFYRSPYPFIERFSFPIFTIVSKFYALCLSCYYQFSML